MALLNSFEPIKPLIPVPRIHYYIGPVIQLPSEVTDKSKIYAIVVDQKTHSVIRTYRALFVLFLSEKTHYLFISDYDKELSSSTLYISTKATESPTDRDWGFNKDDIGLYVIAGTRHQEKIYFATDYSDRKIVEKEIENLKNKETLITEKIYV